jgi:hypothetical protein
MDYVRYAELLLGVERQSSEVKTSLRDSGGAMGLRGKRPRDLVAGDTYRCADYPTGDYSILIFHRVPIALAVLP